jgi:pimeloyl-ACP methyl ester carboxylesterase
VKKRRVVAGAVLIGVIVAPWIFDPENREVDRSSLRGKLMTLSDGAVHYELAGTSTVNPTIVMIHGVSGPMTVWDRLVPRLTEAGFRTLRYDLYGRGGSDRADVIYGGELYRRQLFELLEKLQIARPVVLMGSSMGAIVAVDFRNHHPEKVARLVLIGPAGFPIEASPLARFLDVPGLGEYAISVFGDSMLREHHRKYFFRAEDASAAAGPFAEQLRIKGTKKAILSTMRSMPVRDYADGYAAVGQSAVPILLIWGREDRTFPHAHHRRALELMPRAKLVTIEKAGHVPQLEAAPEVGEKLIEFFAEN